MHQVKKINFILLIIIFYTPFYFSQQQQHIPWPSLADSPWPVGRGDAQATGRSKFIGPRTPNVIWRKDMPLGIVYGPVIGYNDELFVGTRAFHSGNENYFYSMDKNGKEIWSFITEGGLGNSAGPTITSNGIIYFSSIGNGLYAINPDGTLKWKNEKFIYSIYTRYISVAKNNRIYLPFDDTIYVLDQENGNIIDSIPAPYIAETEIVFSTGGDTIFFISGRLFSVEPKAINAITVSGSLLWSIELGEHNWGTPVVDNSNRVYVFGRDSLAYLYCITPNGSVNWKYPMPLYETFTNGSSPTIDSNGNIFFASVDYDSGYITSLHYNGILKWKTTLGHYYNNGALIDHGLVCDAEGKIYCGSNYGITTNFWCVDNTGEILWKLDLEGYKFDTSPAINSEGTLYIGTHLSSLYQHHQRNLVVINDTGTSGVYDEPEMTFNLYQNYPNPFNPVTHINYKLMERTNVTLRVFNIMAEEIKTLVDEEQITGYYSVVFDGKDLPSGVYFYELVTAKTRLTKKMILLK